MAWHWETAETFNLVPLCLPYCVFFMYFMDNSVGTRICKAMFYNCDLAMLKYPWYRQGEAPSFSAAVLSIAVMFLPYRAAYCDRKRSASGRMSSGRSRSGGSVTWIVLIL